MDTPIVCATNEPVKPIPIAGMKLISIREPDEAPKELTHDW